MGNPTSTNAKLDLIIDSIQEIRDMRKDVISLVEWKNGVNEKLNNLQEKNHDCIKTDKIVALETTIASMNKFKWWFLGVLFMLLSTMVTFSINVSKEYVQNKTNIVSNKENIEKLDKRVENIRTHMEVN
jgi:uncharacterized coiled-coil DUF342 family protein